MWQFSFCSLLKIELLFIEEQQEMHEYTVWAKYGCFLILKHVVRPVTTEFEMVNDRY